MMQYKRQYYNYLTTSDRCFSFWFFLLSKKTNGVLMTALTEMRQLFHPLHLLMTTGWSSWIVMSPHMGWSEASCASDVTWELCQMAETTRGVMIKTAISLAL